jgi:hypothetical protein
MLNVQRSAPQGLRQQAFNVQVTIRDLSSRGGIATGRSVDLTIEANVTLTKQRNQPAREGSVSSFTMTAEHILSQQTAGRYTCMFRLKPRQSDGNFLRGENWQTKALNVAGAE